MEHRDWRAAAPVFVDEYSMIGWNASARFTRRARCPACAPPARVRRVLPASSIRASPLSGSAAAPRTHEHAWTSKPAARSNRPSPRMTPPLRQQHPLFWLSSPCYPLATPCRETPGPRRSAGPRVPGRVGEKRERSSWAVRGMRSACAAHRSPHASRPRSPAVRWSLTLTLPLTRTARPPALATNPDRPKLASSKIGSSSLPASGSSLCALCGEKAFFPFLLGFDVVGRRARMPVPPFGQQAAATGAPPHGRPGTWASAPSTECAGRAAHQLGQAARAHRPHRRGGLPRQWLR